MHWYLFGSGSCMFARALWHVGGGSCSVHSFLCHRKFFSPSMIYTYFLFAPNSTFYLRLNTPSLLKVSTPKISHSGHLLAIQISWSMQAKNLFSALLFYRHFPFPTLNTLTIIPSAFFSSCLGHNALHLLTPMSTLKPACEALALVIAFVLEIALATPVP